MFTSKGKAQGISEEWKDFRKFFNDVNKAYEKGKVLRRKDTSKPFSVNNFMWVTKEEYNLSYIHKNSVRLFYEGELLTLKEISIKYNVGYSALRNRYQKRKEGTSIKEIIFGKQSKRNGKPPKNATINNIRLKVSKMISSYRCKDRKSSLELCDIDIDWMIENIISKPCIYCGDTNNVGCDRIDNNKGHLKENVVPCCVDCNVARSNHFSFEEMKILGQTIKQIKEARKAKDDIYISIK